MLNTTWNPFQQCIFILITQLTSNIPQKIKSPDFSQKNKINMRTLWLEFKHSQLAKCELKFENAR